MPRVFGLVALGALLFLSQRARADEVAQELVQEEGTATVEPTTAEATSASEVATTSEAVTTPLPSVDATSAGARAQPTDEDEEDARIAAGMAERQRLRPWHILFGNLTWAASNVATLLGFITFHDRYGFDGNPLSAGCAGPSPIFGDTCARGSVPIAHVVAVTALTLFYGSSFTIGAVMPDPLGVGEGTSEHATEINVHRALRWTSLAIMALQIVLGAISQNVEFSDFGADRAMAATHLALGTVSWGVLTAQGIVGSLLAY